MNIADWKKLDDRQRKSIAQNIEVFNPYSDNAYEMVRTLGKEIAGIEKCSIEKVGVLNRYGELIIHLHVPEDQLETYRNKDEPRYYGFRVFYSGESSWFQH